MNNTIDKGYTVIYDTPEGKIGFIGEDMHSGGYPFFSSIIEYKNVYANINSAFALLKSAKKMTNWYGAHRVHFGTMRVVKIEHVFTEITEAEEDIFLRETLEKLNDDELAVLKRHKIIGELK